MNFKSLFGLLLFLAVQPAIAQIGIDNPNPDASAILDLTSTSKGLLAPRMTQAERNAISSPATGLLIYQTDATDGFYVYDGAAWIKILLDGNFTVDSPLELRDGVFSLTAASTPGQVLKWNGTAWTPGDDLGTTYTNGTGLNLSGTTFSIDSSVVTSNYSGLVNLDNLIVSGTVTANVFVGDGSRLTNLPATVTAGSGLFLSGNELKINDSAAGTGIELSNGVFSIDSSVVTSNYSGNVTVGGAMTANSFHGSGVGLTGITPTQIFNALSPEIIPASTYSSAYPVFTNKIYFASHDTQTNAQLQLPISASNGDQIIIYLTGATYQVAIVTTSGVLFSSTSSSTQTYREPGAHLVQILDNGDREIRFIYDGFNSRWVLVKGIRL